jgi:putative transposase
MSTREIQGHLEEIYKVEVSASLISEVTDAVLEDAKAWQNRPLENLYPVLFLDALLSRPEVAGHREALEGRVLGVGRQEEHPYRPGETLE